MILPYSSSGTNCTTRHPDVQQLKPLNHQALCPNPSQPHSLSPYSVVELIGPKLFWIARRTIVHRQRILAIQVFELHRLIKVQKLIAASPDILFENNFYLTQPSIRSSMKKLLSNNVHEPSAVAVKAKVDPPKPITFEHSADNNAHENLLTLDNENDKRHIPQQATQNSYVGTTTSRSVASDSKLAPRCYQLPLPGNQWLVPIRSPSEGLVYKPYTGPCPPPAGLVASTYGNFTPVNLSAVRGDFSKFQSQVVEDHNTEQRIQVIKVVPHNPKTAPESAARIFRSIQEERKLHFSLTL
nr:PREDICTED: protein EARLY FLOWERING 3-like isoform X2 [Nicotiana tabacum]XP_016466697.1 PREDICTED: protein EARLY FLOWERING 3-like isoform X2 [Nicotiana tabacum]